MNNIPAIAVLGKLTFEPTDPPRPLGTYVVQRVKPGFGNVLGDTTGSLQVRIHGPRVDANSAPQQLRRQRLRNAVAAWRALDATARGQWRVRGEQRRISGFNCYVSAWLRDEITTPPAGAAYSPPLAHAVAYDLSATYTPPAADAVPFQFN